jgi:uncharacterized protein (DUF1778 family)
VTAERRDLPMTPYARPVLQQVAAASNRTLIAFLFESGLHAAHDALADRRVFGLDDPQEAGFVAARSRSCPR